MMPRFDSSGLLERGPRMAGVAAGAAALVAVACFIWAPVESARSWLVGFSFWFGITVGSLGLLLLHSLLGGDWGRRIRPILYSAASTIPLMALLFVPIALSLHRIYPWSGPDAVAAPTPDTFKAAYLNDRSFVLRAACLFVIWIILWLILRAAVRRPATESPRRLRAASATGLIVFVLTMTCAAVDWLMSLEPHWFSSAFGLIVLVGDVLLALAFTIVIAARLSPGVLHARDSTDPAARDLGNLLLAFLMLWGYVAFSQYLIIWSGNLPEEITYYLNRTSGPWQTVAWALIIVHFFLPFLLLLNRQTKQHSGILSAIAGFIVIMRLVDVVWLIEPAFDRGSRIGGFALDALMLVAIGGLWSAWFLTVLRRALVMIPPIEIDSAVLSEEVASS